MSDKHYPPVNFYFALSFSASKEEATCFFGEVAGISTEWETERIKEGGENRFSHKVPGRSNHQNLVLKRGQMRIDSEIAKWIQESMEGMISNPIQVKAINVGLWSADGNRLINWTFFGAFPIKWTVAGSESGSIIIESLEFAYQTAIKTMENQ